MCRFILSDRAHLLIEEDEAFLKWRVPWAGIGALLAWSSSVSEWSSGSSFASGWSGALDHIELSSSASKKVSGSGFASGWTHLRFNIVGDLQKQGIGTSMPKLVQLAGLSN